MHTDIFYNGADVFAAYEAYCKEQMPKGKKLEELKRLTCGWYRLDDAGRKKLLESIEPYVIRETCYSLMEKDPRVGKTLMGLGSILDDWYFIRKYCHDIARRAIIIAMEQVKERQKLIA